MKVHMLSETVAFRPYDFLIDVSSGPWDYGLPGSARCIDCLNKNILVGAICGATLALADYGILDKFKHTSNSLEYLNFFSKNYAGQSSYVCSNSVLDRNLVTASSAGSLEWTKNILKSLNVYSDKKITAFYNYYSTGNVKYYDELL